MIVAVLHPVKGRDLEADIRSAIEMDGAPSVIVAVGSKLYDAERQWRIDADMETGAGSWAIDGYDVRLTELTGADRKVAQQLIGSLK